MYVTTTATTIRGDKNVLIVIRNLAVYNKNVYKINIHTSQYIGIDRKVTLVVHTGEVDVASSRLE